MVDDSAHVEGSVLPSYPACIMDAQAETPNSGSRSLRSNFFAALVGACGVGMQLARTVFHYRHSNDRGDLLEDIVLCVVFLAIAVVNSVRVLPRLHDQKRSA